MSKKKNRGTLGIIKKQFRILIEIKKGYMILLMLFNMFVSGILPVIAVFIPRIIIDYLTIGAGQNDIIRSLIWLIIASVILASLSVIMNGIKGYEFIDARVVEFNKMCSKILGIDYFHLENPKFIDRFDTATRTLSGNDNGYEGTLHNIYNLLPALLSALLYCMLIGIFQPLIFIACIIGTIITILVNRAKTKYEMSKRDDLARTSRRRNYFYNTCYDFSYGKEIRIYNLAEKLANDYTKRSYSYISVIRQIANRNFRVGFFELIMLLIQDGLAYFFIIKGYYDGRLTLGEVSMYVGAVIAFSTVLRTIRELSYTLYTNTEYTGDYFKLLNDDSLIATKGNRVALDPEETLEIEFKDVSFKYPNTDRYILKDFNFKINKGEKLAIVGTNGAGKSTIIKLITGLFEVSQGDIFINGINIKEFNTIEYQKMFSVVFQEVNIYASSIIKNVIGTDDSFEAQSKGKLCLERVGLKEKIESLPLKYDTPLLKIIDDCGVELSGGQNQKIAIARALYKDANMVILDEPTAALDALAEAEIYQSFDDLVKHKTAIYISHRLSSTKFCDKIALFSNNGLVEYGNHEELMGKKGEYYKMFTTQGKYYQSEVNKDE